MTLDPRYIAAHADHVPVYEGIHETHWYQDNERDNWFRAMADSDSRRQLEHLGWHSETAVSYRRNRHGFRGDNFTDHTDLICLGCSFTFGFGIPEEHSWPSVLAKRLASAHVNLGVCGAANDTMFRLARYWIPRLQPKTVAVLQTWPYRWEVCEYDGANPASFLMHRVGRQEAESVTDPMLKKWILNDINHEISCERNQRAIQQICHEHDCRAVFVDVTQYLDLGPDDLARDLAHPGVKWHAAMADTFYQLLKD